MGKLAAVAFTLGLALLGIGLPDLLPDGAKLGVTIGAAGLLVAGAGLWGASRWAIVPRSQLRPASKAASLPTPAQDHARVPTRMPLVQAIEQHATRLGDMLDARFADSPGPKGGLAEIMADKERYDAERDTTAPQRAVHDRRTLAIYFEQFRTAGLPLFDEAVDVWWAGNPKARPLVEKPTSVEDLRKVEAVFRRLAHNLREKETDKAMEARGFRKQYVAIDTPQPDPATGLPSIQPR